MPFRPTLPRRCSSSHESKLSSFLSALSSLPSSSFPSSPPPPPPASPTPAAYNALMSTHSRAGRHGEVLRLFRSLPFPPTAPLYTTLISSLADSGQPLAARAAFAALLRSGVLPTASAFTALLKSSPRDVDRVFGAMCAAGVSPDAAFYNCVISMHCDLRLVQGALGFLDLMLENGLRPTARSFTAILRAYCEQEMFQEAEMLVDLMIENGFPPDVVSYSVLIEGLCRVGEFGKVEMILGERKGS
uniref:Pentacotripeptide-repeat region of PRORP domain-containing protein n=1 Tax=Leersia perrieri TaxID=77586 RepID=A0A0D9VR95_9ORYZ